MIIKDIEKKEIFGLRLVNVSINQMKISTIFHDDMCYDKDNNKHLFSIFCVDNNVNKLLILGSSKR